MDYPRGVKVDIYQTGRLAKLAVEEGSGCLGRLRVRMLTLRVCIAPFEPIYGFVVDDSKNITPMENLAFPSSFRKGVKLFKLRIPVSYLYDRTVGQFVFCTTYPSNNLRLLQLTGDGKICIWEIAVISQGGVFFSTIQKTYTAQCNLSADGGIVCPMFNRWQQLLDFIRAVNWGVGIENMAWYDALMSSRYVQTDSSVAIPSSAGLASNQGRVVWWNLASGIGLIDTPQGVAIVRWSNISEHGRLYSYFVTGERVSFERIMTVQIIGRKPTLSQTAPLTISRKEAKGVRLA